MHDKFIIKIIKKYQEKKFEKRVEQKAILRTFIKACFPEYQSQPGSYFVLEIKNGILEIKRKARDVKNKPIYLISYSTDGVYDIQIYTDYDEAHQFYESFSLYGDNAYIYDLTLMSPSGRGLDIPPEDPINTLNAELILANCDYCSYIYASIKSKRGKSMVRALYL